jgi:hypothetical protein
MFAKPPPELLPAPLEALAVEADGLLEPLSRD